MLWGSLLFPSKSTRMSSKVPKVSLLSLMSASACRGRRAERSVSTGWLEGQQERGGARSAAPADRTPTVYVTPPVTGTHANIFRERPRTLSHPARRLIERYPTHIGADVGVVVVCSCKQTLPQLCVVAVTIVAFAFAG